MFISRINWIGISIILEEDKAIIDQVSPNSRASSAGLEEGDQLFSLDGQEYAAQTWQTLLKEIKPNKDSELIIHRGSVPLKITIQRAPKGYMGIRPQNVPTEERETAGLSTKEGVYIRSVLPDGPADKAGLEKKDILLQMNGEVVGLEGLGGILENIGAGETISCLILRDGIRQSISLTLGEIPK